MPESPTRSGSRITSALLTTPTIAALVTALLLGSLGLASPSSAAIKAARGRYAAAIEPLAGYQAQTTCSPSAKAGVVDFSQRLMRAYPTTRSLGIVRACSAGGRSEHKEGRAFDWAVNARSAADRARVNATMKWLLKTDKYGNRFAMARRLGIQYMIWNRKIWGAYAAGSGWRKYTGASAHTDHVHFSFTWAGARGKTSFWTGKPGRVAPAPTPDPGAGGRPPIPVPQPDNHPNLPGVPTAAPRLPRPPVTSIPRPPVTSAPRPTTTPTPRPTVPAPLPVPAAPVELPTGPALLDETLSVAATGGGALTTGALQAGQDYLVEVSGTYQWGASPDQVADAECSRTATDATWRRDRSVHTAQSWEDHLDLYLDGADLWADPDVNTGSSCDTRTHTYRDTITATRTGRVTLALWDPTTLADNAGALTVRIIALTPKDTMDWTLPAAAAAGVTSPGALEAGGTYVLTVTGTVDAGGGVSADAECASTPADPTWTWNRSIVETAPTADHLDVLIDRSDVTFTAVTDPDRDGCDATGHAYRRTITPSSTRAINLRVDDPVWADNTGELAVHVERVRPVTGTETVVVDTAGPNVETLRNYLAGQALLLTVSGTYTYSPGLTADARCSATTADPIWRATRTDPLVTGGYVGDLQVNRSARWVAVTPNVSCDPDRAYTWAYTPSVTGPLDLDLPDPDHADNSGLLTVTVSPAGV